MDFLPIFLDLRGRRCLIVGGGVAAAGRAALLRRAGAQVAIVADDPHPALRQAVRRGEATIVACRFDPTLLDGTALVMVAGERLAVGEMVADAAKARGIPVNVMDETALCSFIMPAIVDRSPVVLAVSTGGTAPLLAGLLRRWLDGVLPQRLGGLARLAGRFRVLAHRRLPDGIARRRFWERILTCEVAKLALAGEETAAGAALLRALEESADPPRHVDAA